MPDYPRIKIGIHISGPLLLYMIERRRELLDLVKDLTRRGIIELLAGAYGEAILPVIPRDDIYKHIELYLELFNNIFKFKPRGFWLAERIWEPSVVEPLASNGIEYTIVDDYILPKIVERDLAGYAWITEDNGHRLKLLFVDERIRYVLPWETPEKVIRYIISRGNEYGNRYILWGSDAEKFGEWSEKSWAVKWLREFFELLDSHSDVIKTTTPSEYIDKCGVKGLIYPVYGSYDKMMSWSLGYFRNFFVKYKESNYMHKRALWLRKKLKRLKAPEEAWRYYYLAQCNDAYWHGLFGGIYVTHLRQAIYENMIRAEIIAEEASNYFNMRDIYISVDDIDFDGFDEAIVETKFLDLVVKPNDGGTIHEISFKYPIYEHNVVSTMSRYKEPYLTASISFKPDWYQRVCAREHLWSPGIGLWDWINNTPFIDQSNLALGIYGLKIISENILELRYRGYFYGKSKSIPIEVIKQIYIEPRMAKIRIGHSIENIGNEEFTARIGFDYHLSPRVPREKKEGYQLYSPMPGVVKHPEEIYAGVGRNIRIINNMDIDIVVDKDIDIWVAPVVMPTRTERGVIDILQAIGLMFSKVITLNPSDRFILSIEIALRKNSNDR